MIIAIVGLSVLSGVLVGMLISRTILDVEERPGSSQNDYILELVDKDGGTSVFKSVTNVDDIDEDIVMFNELQSESPNEIKNELNRIFKIKE